VPPTYVPLFVSSVFPDLHGYGPLVANFLHVVLHGLKAFRIAHSLRLAHVYFALVTSPAINRYLLTLSVARLRCVPAIK
jgi:hypothetical protein